MTSQTALPAGTELKQYTIRSVLGQGGFGITYLAWDNDLSRQVAIKECFPSDFVQRDGSAVLPTSEANATEFEWALGRFVEEATTLARFRHPGIVNVLQILKGVNNTAYMVLEFVEGQSLESWLTGLGRPPTQKELSALIAPLADALDNVHQAGVIHRDIAPDNIYLRDTGEAVLLDFGSAKHTVNNRSRSLRLVVKDGYSAPEQYYAEGKQGPWTDVYALSATLYRAITGLKCPPSYARDSEVSSDDADPLRPLTLIAPTGYDANFLSAIDKGMALRLKQRPQSIGEWRALLNGRSGTVLQAARLEPAQGMAADGRTLAPPDPAPGAPAKPRRRTGLFVTLALVAVALAGAAAKVVISQREAARIADSAWSAAMAADSRTAYAGFIEQHGDDPRASAARSRLAEIPRPWNVTVAGGADTDSVRAVLAMPDGSVLVAGGLTDEESEAAGAGTTPWIAHYSEGGRLLAEHRSTDQAGSFTALLVNPDRTVIAAGATLGAVPVLRQFNAELEPIADITLDLPGADTMPAEVTALTARAEGGFVAAGRLADQGLLVSFDAMREITWHRLFAAGPGGGFNALAELTDGSLVAAGEARAGDDTQFWIVKTDALGETLIDRQTGGQRADRLTGVAALGFGAALMVGETASFGSGGSDAIAMMLTTDNKLPPQMFATPGLEGFTAVRALPDGSAVLAGWTSTNVGVARDGWLLRVSGTLRETIFATLPGGGGEDVINAVDVLPNGSIVIGGSSKSFGQGSIDAWIAKLTPEGLSVAD
ncbi:MAG: serine/threonine protein kinase [Rhizobiaceae bacterium]|nr:serine/threonine protein kinase [Rhizobiaceae bacterium]